jgi:hypothetical protein
MSSGRTAARSPSPTFRRRAPSVGSSAARRRWSRLCAEGLLSLEEACSRYTLTVEEFLSWQYSIDRHGLAGLRTTRIQQYRQ